MRIRKKTFSQARLEISSKEKKWSEIFYKSEIRLNKSSFIGDPRVFAQNENKSSLWAKINSDFQEFLILKKRSIFVSTRYFCKMQIFVMYYKKHRTTNDAFPFTLQAIDDPLPVKHYELPRFIVLTNRKCEIKFFALFCIIWKSNFSSPSLSSGVRKSHPSLCVLEFHNSYNLL